MKYPPNHFLGAQRNGLNHVGMEIGTIDDRDFGPIRDRHLGGAEYPVYSNKLLNWYVTKNVKSVRLMFAWEAVQRTLMGDVPATAAGVGYGEYWEDLVGLPASVLRRLLDRGIYVILCPLQHNSMSGKTDMVYDDKAFYLDHNAPNKPFTSKFFANFWGKFAKAINDATKAINDPTSGVLKNQQLIAFDLINEPHLTLGGKDVGILLDQWFTCAQDAITAIRATGATNTIFVPGMNFADAESFTKTTNGSSAAWLKHPVTTLPLTDPLTNIAVTVHCYSGITKLPGQELRSKKGETALPDACSALVTWARPNGIKVNIGEIALDAGQNRTPIYCTESDRAHAEKQWDLWNTFCRENNDVLVGWNWWSNGERDWLGEDDSCGEDRNHWALTRDNGQTQTVYMDLIEDTLAPILRIQDNRADTGSEPNNTTSHGYESVDVWVTQPGVRTFRQFLQSLIIHGGKRNLASTLSRAYQGGKASEVHVKVTNNGREPYNPKPGKGHEVRLYWAKAETGLNWPKPWDGSVGSISSGGSGKLVSTFYSQSGGKISSQPIPVPIPANKPAVPGAPPPPPPTATVTFNWTTPNPEDYPDNDGHFSLLAFVARTGSPEWEGFRVGVDLNDNVLKLSNVAWRNIHLLPAVRMKMGNVVVAKAKDYVVRASQFRWKALSGK